MSEENTPNTPLSVEPDAPASEVHVNEYGRTKDASVLIEEENRSVLLTENETIVFEKQPHIAITPANRPRRVYGGMWGTPEVAAVAVASLAVLSVLLLYFLIVRPSNLEVERTRAESDRLQLDLTSATSKYGAITNTETRVGQLIASVNDFELDHLTPAPAGKNALYQRVNSLITGYGLTNTSGPDYVPLEAPDQDPGQQSEEERGRSKFRSVFPGIYVTMTLEGPYQNLRRFVSDIERGSDFIVISAIELEPTDSENHKPDTAGPDQAATSGAVSPGGQIAPGISRPSGTSAQSQPPVQSSQPSKGKTHGEVVSLRLELAAYFRRPTFVPIEPLPGETGGGTR
jgi:hypothetical protein